jgi:hypothetical protein
MRRLVTILLAAGATGLVCVAVAMAGHSTTPPSPQTLYQRLLTSSIPDSALPSAYSSSSTGVSKPSDNAKRHHVVGEVEIDIDDGDAGIVYMVFPTRADAVADWKDANLRAHAKSTLNAPSSFPWPALIANQSVTGKNAFGKTVTNGVTALAFTSQNVIVEAVTTSVDNTESGDIPGAITLGRYALAHLQALRK